MNKIIVLFILLFLLYGCIQKEIEEPDFFETSAFRIGDKITYELWGKMTVKGEKGFFIYVSRGEASIKVREDRIKDGFENECNVIDFYINMHEIPYNYTPEGEIEGLPIEIEKHVYRLYNNNSIGGVIKSLTIHHAINRDRYIEIFSMPFIDIIDYFLQKEFRANTNGSFVYENMLFKWTAKYDKKFNSLRIDVYTNSNSNFSIWLKNGIPFPYQIEYREKIDNRINRYTYIFKKLVRGKGKEIHLGNVDYRFNKKGEYAKWKFLRIPIQGENGMKMRSEDAFNYAIKFSTGAENYGNLAEYLNKFKDAYAIFARYWENRNVGWEIYFGRQGSYETYVMNISLNISTGKKIKTNEGFGKMLFDIYPYYEGIPIPFEEISDEILTISSAEKIFSNITNYDFKNFSFRISYVEIYYPDSLFDIWEGNRKEKEISKMEERGACFIDGFHKVVKEYKYGYRLVALSMPFISFDAKINGQNGMITYIYREI